MVEPSWIYDLYRLGQVSALRENPAQVQHRILEHIVQHFNADSGSLTICDGNQGDLVLTAGIGLPDAVIGSHICKRQGVIGWVAEHGEPVLITDDPGKDPRFENYVPRSESATPGSAICWPMKQENRLIGTLCVNRNAAGQPFTEVDMERFKMLVSLVSIAVENMRLHQEQAARIQRLSELNRRLEDAQSQLLQSEKMASIGQLAAGVAHEINNPIGFVYSNLGALERYLADLLGLVEGYEAAEASIGDAAVRANLQGLKQKMDLAYLREDVVSVMNESRDGITRVKTIVQNLKDFSRADSGEAWQWTSLERGLDSTLNIVWNELKYKCEVKKEYGDIPDIECLPAQLNQVFMNILMNASHAIEGRGVITLRTGIEDDQAWVEIEDTGKGIAPEHLTRIFDPFFTTKPAGKGTGLGLSISFSIVQKHHGRFEVNSEPGKGTRFRVCLPVRQPSGDPGGSEGPA